MMLSDYQPPSTKRRLCSVVHARCYELEQSDALTACFEYPARTSPGPAIVVIEDVKGVKPQKPWITPSVSCRAILAYATYKNLRTFGGMSMPTGYESSAAAALRNAGEEAKPPASSGPLHSLRNWHIYLPRGHPRTPGVPDMWIRATSGERIPQAALPYVMDTLPFNMHASGGKGGVDRDMEGQVRDTEGEIVALSHHVALIVSIEKIMKKEVSSTKASL
ncbi:thioesterase family protein [Hypoxylon cercidicola]|nr:thioesterase family protein [Hypoxylon cercidicola]